MHARKTRQRKKEHMQNLQNRAAELKSEQLRLRQTINEKNTASILIGLFSVSEKQASNEDPKIEALLRRPAEAIPDASKIPELPALILPGQHNTKRGKTAAATPVSPEKIFTASSHFPDDGIDYELLKKDRSKCSPAELDQIRRERNRMHAKRTRDRKRLFMEEMEEMIKQLENENDLLVGHLTQLGGDHDTTRQTPFTPEPTKRATPSPSHRASDKDGESAAVANQIMSLLQAAGASEKKQHGNLGMLAISSIATAVSTSTDDSCSDQDETLSNHSAPTAKRRRIGVSSNVGVPTSITAATTAIGC